ncbi:MAG TPA: glycosyl hydrolase family 18 protein [Ktedonobacteraceae bacterium]
MLLPSILLLLAIECIFGYNIHAIAKNSSTASAAKPNVSPANPPVKPTNPSVKPANAFSFAPYILVDPASTQDQNPNIIVQTEQLTGAKYYTLSFILGNNCQAEWWHETAKSALPPVVAPSKTPDRMLIAITQLRKLGGDVIISFGGAAGQELALTCLDAASLQKQYQNIINTYHVTHLDFDVDAAADATSINRRNQALAALQKVNRNLVISYTLPADTNGLTANGLSVLQNAAQNGVKVSLVNVMAMDYGGSAPADQMGQNAIAAAQAAEKQFASISLSAKIGITPMIAQNDTSTEIFTTQDANILVNFAKGDSQIGELSMWALRRDRPCPGGASGGPATSLCSSISAPVYAFTKIFNQFHNGSAGQGPS